MRVAEGVTTDDFDRDVWCLLGIPVDAVDMVGALLTIKAAAAERRPCFLSTPNVNFLVGCQSDRDFRKSVIDSDLSIADGMPLVWIARHLGIPIRERVSGSGMIEALREQPADNGEQLSVFFLGGEEGVAEEAYSKLNEMKCGLRCAGYYYPGFGSVEDMSGDEIITAINESDADFVIVSLGAKKGQAWIQRNRGGLNAPVISHLGAVVNFIAGTTSRAPAWIQKMGLEWLWRIKEEPSLWRRYWSDGIALASIVITRVLPYALWRQLNRPAADIAGGKPVVSAELQGEEYRIVLSGALTESNLQGIRKEFRQAASSESNVKVDLKAVSYVDPAFLGLLLMLEKHVTFRSKKLYVTGQSSKVIKIFKWNVLDYLLK